MRTLTLDPRSIIVPMKAGLRVYSTQGTVELRSRNLAGVHEMLQGRLAGQYTEQGLVSAVPSPQRMTVRKYLRALHDAGAIECGRAGAAGYLRREPDTVAKPRLVAKRSRAGDDGQLRKGKQARLQYVTGRDFVSLLVRKVVGGTPARRQIYVLTDESSVFGSGSECCDRQALYSKWLLGRDFSHREKPKIEVFQIDTNTGALRRKATLAGKSLAINREVPAALELVRATDIEQAPLAVCQPDSMLGVLEVRRFGVDYDRVADEVLRDLLVRMTIEDADAVRQIRWERMTIPRMATATTRPRVVRADECLVAASLTELRLALLERVLRQTQRTPVHEEPCDLLQSWSSPDLDYLARVLRLRHSCLEAQLTTRVDGLYHCVHGDLRTSSLIKHKAIRDLMILLTWTTYYGHCHNAPYKPAHDCDYSLIAKPVQLRKLFSRTAGWLREEMVQRSPLCAKISCWGKTAWLGMLHG